MANNSTPPFIARIEAQFKEQAKIALLNMANRVLEDWKAIIRKKVYDEDSLKAKKGNDYYKRTNELIDSLEVKIEDGEGMVVSIAYNLDNIQPHEKPQGYTFNQHLHFGGTDVSNFIPTFVEEGFSSSVHSYQGIGAHAEILADLNASFQKKFAEEMLKQGIPIKK